MKEYFKLIIFTFFSILITIAIFIVDVAFYRTPTFIQVFRIEREVAIVIAAFLMWLVVKEVHNKHINSVEKNLLFIGIGILSLSVILLTPPLLISKYITLWDNNPLLAEFPVVWSAVSATSSMFFVFVIIFLIFCLRYLFLCHQERYTRLLINLLIFILFLSMIAFNFFENRYSFQPIYDSYIALYTHFQSIIFAVAGLAGITAFRGGWINDLNKKQKIISFCIGLIVLIISIYIFLSQYIVSVFAYSTSLKGFVIVSLGSIIIIISVFLIRLLFRLPQAAYFDRVAIELKSFTNIAEMIRAGRNFNEVIDSIVNYTIEILDAHNCWVELKNNDGKLKIIAYANLSDDLVKQVDSFTDAQLHEIVISRQKECIINDITNDEKTAHFRYIDFSGRSLLAVPLIIKGDVVGILYVGKKRVYGFKKRDINTVHRYLLQIDTAWNNFDVSEEKKPGELFSKRPVSKIVNDNISLIKLTNYDIGLIIPDRDDVLCEIVKGGENILVGFMLYEKQHNISDFSEVKGVFKTLLNLETNPQVILDKFQKILGDKENILNLSIYIFNGKSKEQCMYSQNCNILLNLKKDTILIDEKIVKEGSLSISMDESGIILNNYDDKIKSNLIDLFNVRDKILFNQIAESLVKTPGKYLMNENPIDSIIIYRKQQT